MSGMFSGAKKVKGHSMSSGASQAEANLINQLSQQVQGQGPSLANMQYEKALNDSIMAQKALNASTRGVSNVGLMARNAQQAGIDLSRDQAQNSAINRMQEQQSAQSLLSQNLGTQRGIALQADLANQQAETNYRNQNMQLVGNLGAAGATIATGGGNKVAEGAADTAAAAASDERVKENKKKTNASALDAVNEFLKSAESYEYNYIGDDTKRNGVMAQDLEESSIGKQMVSDTPSGKVVDYGQGFSALMASIAELNKKVSKIEKKKA
jgi:hypothetical protein